MSQIDVAITDLSAQVARNTSVMGSAKILIEGFNDRLGKAIEAASAAGATPAQLVALNDLNHQVKLSDDDLAAAVAANTPPPAISAAVGDVPTETGAPDPPQMGSRRSKS